MIDWTTINAFHGIKFGVCSAQKLFSMTVFEARFAYIAIALFDITYVQFHKTVVMGVQCQADADHTGSLVICDDFAVVKIFPALAIHFNAILQNL